MRKFVAIQLVMLGVLLFATAVPVWNGLYYATLEWWPSAVDRQVLFVPYLVCGLAQALAGLIAFSSGLFDFSMRP